jgi:hypothetical protein
MPAGPIGSVWAAGTWTDVCWEADTWADVASISPATGSNLVTVAARDRVAVVPRRDRVVNLKS